MKRQNKPLTNRQRQAIETKEKIYNAAISVINEKGYCNASIQEITEAAAVAKGSFYTYFHSKEDLVFYTYVQSDMAYRSAYAQVEALDFLSATSEFIRSSYAEHEKRGKEILKAIVISYSTENFIDAYTADRALLRCFSDLVDRGKQEQVIDAHISNSECVNLFLSVLIGVETMGCFGSEPGALADKIATAIRVVAQGMIKQPQLA